MAKRLTKVSDLPDWFNTENYTGILKLDARGWYEQLSIRELCYNMVRCQIEGDLLYEGELANGELLELFGCDPAEFLEAVRTSPILLFRDSKFEQCVEEIMGFDYPGIYQREYPPGVHGITPMDIRGIMRGWGPQLRDEFLNWVQSSLKKQKVSGKRVHPPSPQRNWVFRPVTLRNRKPIMVNAFLPRKVVRRSLDQFIAQEMAHNSTNPFPKELRSNTFLEWCNCGLLQYIDLKIWSLQEKTRITNKVLAQTIFPKNPDKGEENIRTTTKKHAAMILDMGSMMNDRMSVLLAYARLEGLLENSEAR